MSVEVQLVGGPADGVDVVLPGDPMDPPSHVELKHLAMGSSVRTLTYSREVNPGDEGPLWLYRYTEGRAA